MKRLLMAVLCNQILTFFQVAMKLKLVKRESILVEAKKQGLVLLEQFILIKIFS